MWFLAVAALSLVTKILDSFSGSWELGESVLLICSVVFFSKLRKYEKKYGKDEEIEKTFSWEEVKNEH